MYGYIYSDKHVVMLPETKYIRYIFIEINVSNKFYSCKTETIVLWNQSAKSSAAKNAWELKDRPLLVSEGHMGSATDSLHV